MTLAAVPIDFAEACAFVEKHHRHHHPDIHIADAVAAIFEARLLVGVPDDELAAHFGDLMPVAELLAMTLPASVGSMLSPLAPRDAEAAWMNRLRELGGTQ